MLEHVNKIVKNKPIKIIFSGKKDGLYNKVNIRPVEIKGNSFYQIESFTDKQVFHENIKEDELIQKIVDLLNSFSQLNAFCEEYEFSIRITKKGKLLFNSKKAKNITATAVLDHNRQKNYILSEGTIIPPLIDLGIFTPDGRIVKAMYDKYKQINRFVELIDDVIGKESLTKLNIVDFGCGKSYLTFILYYYLVEIKKIDATITGLDLKKDVIEKCNMLANNYGYKNLIFEMGDINGYKTDKPIDMVISLHACDTATDYAIFNAINWQAKYCFFVPCCQHEINNQLKENSFPLITDYGIQKERFATLITDNIRATLLVSCGYDVKIMEFVDIAHSPKNLLIRAVKATVSNEKQQKAKNRVINFLTNHSFKHTLFELIK